MKQEPSIAENPGRGQSTSRGAVALQQAALTDFVIRHAVEAAKTLIDQAERFTLSERDSLRVLELLENPPAPNAKLMKAAYALPERP